MLQMESVMPVQTREKPEFPVRLFWMLSMILLLGTAGGILYYRNETDEAMTGAGQKLQAIRKIKSEQILDWYKERSDDVYEIARRSAIPELVRRWRANPTSQRRTLLQNALNENREFSPFFLLSLADSLTRPLLTTDETVTEFAAPCTDAIREAIRSSRLAASEFYWCTRHGQVHMDFVVPLGSEWGEPSLRSLVLVARIDPSGDFFRKLQTWPEPSATSEVLMVQREGDSVVYANELRHRSGTAMRLQLPLTRTETPAVRAVLGLVQTAEGTDYRGEQVLASYGAVSGTPWSVVAKTDCSEIVDPIFLRVSMISGFVVLILAFAAAFVWIQFTRQQKDYFHALYVLESERQLLARQYENFIANANDGIILFDEQGGIRQMNVRARHMFGFASGDPDAAHMSELLDAGERERLHALVVEAGLGNGSIGEAMYLRKDGTMFPAEASLCRIDVEGRTMYQSIMRDVSERKRMMAAMHESEERYRTLFSTMLEGFALHEVITDETGRPVDYRYLDVNPAFEKQTGIPRERWVGHRVREILPNVEDSWIETFGAIALTGEARHFEDFTKELDRTYEVVAYSPQKGQFAVIITEITARKRAERERERLLEELRHKNRELESIVYAASHDLRSPLVNILGFGQAIAKYINEMRDKLGTMTEEPGPCPVLAPYLESKIPNALKYIQTSAAKMDSLIGGLLRLSRIGRQTLQLQTLDMNRLVETVRTTFAFQLESAGARFAAGLLPACCGDEGQINQVFSNLIDNAIKYRNPSRALELSIDGVVRDGMAVYTVADTGRGIDTDHRKRIFEIFHRLEPGGEVVGEGIGLTLTQRIVERHGGTIYVEANPGGGSAFVVALPQHPPKEQ